MLIYLLRHGQTEYNAQKRYQGQRDIPLSAAGIAQLRQADFAPEVVYVTPLQRTAQTARVFFPGAKLIPVDGLKEMNFGRFEGQTFVQVEQDPEYLAWVQENEHAAHPDGAGHVVQHDVPEAQRGRGGRGDGSGGAAQHGPHAGDELHDAERLAQVVVRTVVQPLDDVDLAGFGRDHNDRQRAGSRVVPQLGQDLIAVLVRQHHVQNDQLGPGLVQRRPKAGAVLAAGGLVTVGLQGILFQFADAGVILSLIHI